MLLICRHGFGYIHLDIFNSIFGRHYICLSSLLAVRLLSIDKYWNEMNNGYWDLSIIVEYFRKEHA